MSCRKTLVFWRCMGFVTVMCGLPSMTLAVIGPFHPGFDHGQLWAQAPRGHLSLDLCDRRNENNTQESWQLVPAVSFPASGTTEQENVSYCETTHHRSGRLWKVQVRSCVSINISWCFSLESGYKLIPPLAEMFTRTLEVPSFASSPNCPNWVWFVYFFPVTSKKGKLCWYPGSSLLLRSKHVTWALPMAWGSSTHLPIPFCVVTSGSFPLRLWETDLPGPSYSCRRTLVPKDSSLDEWFRF